jgi:hypothetical protein
MIWRGFWWLFLKFLRCRSLIVVEWCLSIFEDILSYRTFKLVILYYAPIHEEKIYLIWTLISKWLSKDAQCYLLKKLLFSSYIQMLQFDSHNCFPIPLPIHSWNLYQIKNRTSTILYITKWSYNNCLYLWLIHNIIRNYFVLWKMLICTDKWMKKCKNSSEPCIYTTTYPWFPYKRELTVLASFLNGSQYNSCFSYANVL